MSEDNSPSGQEDEGNPWAALDAKYHNKPTLDLIRAMHEQRGNKDNLEAELKVVNKEYDYLRLKAVPDKFEEEGIEVLKVEGVGRVGLTGDMYIQVVGPKGLFYEYLRDNGSGDLIVETVNASTLKAAVKSWMKKGTSVPEDYLKVTPFTRATITKA